MSNPIPVVICDDSGVARGQMARALSHWNVEITFAGHGLHALEAIRAGKGDVMFLDLNMPIMDGYQVLERIRSDDLPTLVIVVSSDIQPEAREQVLSLGALDFIQKPFYAETVSEVLKRFGLLSELAGESATYADKSAIVTLPDYYQEIANVAMGRAGDRLARFLNTFVHLPIPDVKTVSYAELQAKLKASAERDLHIISQGFVGSGLAGEAMLSLPQDSFQLLAGLLNIEYRPTDELENELLMDVANILIGAFLQSFSWQLNIEFSCGIPVILPPLWKLPASSEPWDQTLSITIEYGLLEDRQVSCELMLIFSEDSLPALQTLSDYF
ncbi:MAG: response regulator [Pontibacterium sp.]